jgi:uncharacterized protein YprB with RNaseH-like and TPR domain
VARRQGHGDFKSRLRRMRREEGAATRQRHAARAIVAGQLGRRSERLSRAMLEREDVSQGDPRDLVREENALGACYSRVLRYELEHVHGEVALGDALLEPALPWRILARDEELEGFGLRGAVYVDTETTGLSGGAGTQVFLIGLGRFVEGGFELWQGFLRDPNEEPALLEACAQRVAGCVGIVSFFGKSFDRHRLHERFAYRGRVSPFLELPHLDLYWLCRRLQPHGAEDGKLRTMERLVAGVERPHDLPGSEAPAAWFAYQREQPHLLEPIFEHHRDDVLSLVTVAARLGQLCAGHAQHAAGTLLAARMLHAMHDARSAEYWERALALLDATARNELQKEHAAALRRLRREHGHVETPASEGGHPSEPFA